MTHWLHGNHHSIEPEESVWPKALKDKEKAAAASGPMGRGVALGAALVHEMVGGMSVASSMSVSSMGDMTLNVATKTLLATGTATTSVVKKATHPITGAPSRMRGHVRTLGLTHRVHQRDSRTHGVCPAQVPPRWPKDG